MKRLALCSSLALLLVACTAPRGEGVSSKTRGAIQGGALDSADKFAVAVLDSTNGVCSGTLIAPNLVLTARHCVAEGGSDPIDCAVDRFDAPRAPSTLRVSGASTADYDTAEYMVTKVLVPSDTLFCGNDLALAIIDTNVTGTTAEPMFDPPDVDAVTAIGYGTTAPGANDDGKRRKLANVGVTCVPGIPARDCDLSLYGMAKTELGAAGGLCEGDSGSGAFVPSSIAAGKPVVVGVLSRAADDGSQCSDAVYARTDAFKKFLVDGASEAATAGGYAVPSWAKPTTSAPDGGDPTPDDSAANPDDPLPAPAAKDPAAPAQTTTTTEAGCSAAPTKAQENWGFVLFLLPFIKRRRRSHSPV